MATAIRTRKREAPVPNESIIASHQSRFIAETAESVSVLSIRETYRVLSDHFRVQLYRVPSGMYYATYFYTVEVCHVTEASVLVIF